MLKVKIRLNNEYDFSRTGKDSRSSTLSSDTNFSDTRIDGAVKDKMDQRVNKDERRLAVLSADKLEDGLILLPGAELCKNSLHINRSHLLS